MNPWMRRSVGTGLFVGGFLALGVGAAHAEDAGMTTPPPDQPILGSVTQLLGGGGSHGGLTSGLSTLTGKTTTYDVPTVSVQNLAASKPAPAPEPAPEPATEPVEATTMLATTEADSAADVTAQSDGKTSDADLAATSGPAPAPAPEPAPVMTTTSKVSSAAEECECSITMGTPTANGAAAGSSGSAQAPAGKPTTVAVPVTNTGDFAVSALAVSGPGGAMECGSTTLAVDASTTCSGSYAPTAGEQSVPVYATGTAPDGTDVST
jgi:hypothetical protein